jgi:hypothetical protein
MNFARHHQMPIIQATIVALATLGRNKFRPYIVDANLMWPATMAIKKPDILRMSGLY